MPIVILTTKDCTCGRRISTRTINIKSFRKEMFPITEIIVRIWNNKKCCWLCKKKPKIKELWGISINYDEKNRMYCPECAEFIEKQLNSQKERE